MSWDLSSRYLDLEDPIHDLGCMAHILNVVRHSSVQNREELLVFLAEDVSGRIEALVKQYDAPPDGMGIRAKD